MIAGSSELRPATTAAIRGGTAHLVVAADVIPPASDIGAGQGEEQLYAMLADLTLEAGGAWVGRRRGEVQSARLGVARVDVRPDDEVDFLRHADETVWPLYHDLCRAAKYHTQWRSAYRRVNAAFAHAVAREAARNAAVWIHDYRLQLVPAQLRRIRPDLRIGFSLHSPFPSPDLFLHMPMRHEILGGLLSADLVGFQTASSAENFLRLRQGLPSSRADMSPPSQALPSVGVYPTTVDSARIRAIASLETTVQRSARLRKDLGAPNAVILSIDSGDDASGVERRLRTIHALFASGQLDPADVAVVQVVAVRPEQSSDDLHDRISREVARINGQFASVGRQCVDYIVSCPDLAERVALYGAADVMMATPLRDGANLFALEFIAACEPTAALVLSEFSGSAASLPDAYIVNPYDEDQSKYGLLAALTASDEERRHRMAPMRQYVIGYDVPAWARAFLSGLESAPRGRPVSILSTETGRLPVPQPRRHLT